MDTRRLRTRCSHTKCACASWRAVIRSMKLRGSATRSKRSIPMARPPEAASRSPCERSLPFNRCCCRARQLRHRSRYSKPEMKLRELAHGRTGDKGDTLNVSVICFDARDYPHLVRHLSAERVKAHLQSIVRGP